MDNKKIRRELMRWTLLQALDNARPSELVEMVVQQTMRAVYPDTTEIEVRRELDYLEERELVKIRKTPDNIWWCSLSRAGIDFVEYTINLEPGIARPEKYW